MHELKLGSLDDIHGRFFQYTDHIAHLLESCILCLAMIITIVDLLYDHCQFK